MYLCFFAGVRKHVGNTSSRKCSFQTIGNSGKLQADAYFFNFKICL